MQTGTYISGIGHIGLIAWALFGGYFLQSDDEPPLRVSEVSLISEAEFAALSSPRPGPQAEVIAPAPPAPEIVEEVPPQLAEESPPEPTPPPQPAPEDPAPDVPPEPDSPPEPPAQEDVAVLAPPAEEAVPAPAPRVAPDPAPAPPTDAEVADTVQEAPAPDEAAEAAQEEQTATAPPEAADRIVTEADEPASAAPTVSQRPRTRPERPSPPAQVATPETPPTETPPAESDPVADALAEAVAADQGGGQGGSTAPTGPPMSAGEKDALRVAVSSCWNVGSLSTEALNTTVVIGVSMGRDGRPDSGSIRLLSSSGGSDAAARQAYEAARRAIIRCGANGYNLPSEKYDHWRDIEMTFNPERMRIK